MRGNKLYWFLMAVDVLFIVFIRFIYSNYDSDTYWYSLPTLLLYRIIVLWLFVLFGKSNVIFKWWEWVAFGLYLCILLTDSIIWTFKTADIVWP